MSEFDPSAFLDSTTTEASVRRPPVPAGSQLTGTIGEPKIQQFQGKKDPSKSYTRLDLPIEFDLSQDHTVHSHVGQDKVVITYGVMLDTNASGIDWSAGKNGRLRAIRDATGTNQPGQPFSLRSLQGRQVGAKIKHREYEGELFEEIEAIVKP